MKKYKEVDELLEQMWLAEQRWKNARDSKAALELFAASVSIIVVFVAVMYTYAVSGCWRDN